MKKLYIPNAITGARLICVPVLSWFIVSRNFDVALWLMVAMSLSDAIDGFLAKRCDWETRFGTFFDPFTDKVMLIVSFFTLSAIGLLPWWLSVLILLSAVMLMTGGTVLYFRDSDFHISPPLVSKFNTAIQYVLIILVLFMYSSMAVNEAMLRKA